MCSICRLDVGNKNIQDFGLKTSWKITTWKVMKEMKGYQYQ